MSFLKYFMFPSARRRMERRERRHAFRDAENAKQDVIDRQKRLEAESKENWATAREAAKAKLFDAPMMKLSKLYIRFSVFWRI